MKKIREWARRLNGEVITVALAMKHPGTPWYAKVLGACIVAYAFSPLDLIPDFIPLLGLVDDVLLLPGAIRLLLLLIPANVQDDCRRQASTLHERPRSVVGAALVILMWILILLAAAAFYLVRRPIHAESARTAASEERKTGKPSSLILRERSS